MKTYSGFVEAGAGGPGIVKVRENDGPARKLNPRFDLRNHSPDGFQWGYAGSGPAQLALALVADAMGDDELAQRVYQDFKFKHVATWGQSWTITSDEISAAVVDILWKEKAV